MVINLGKITDGFVGEMLKAIDRLIGIKPTSGHGLQDGSEVFGGHSS